MKHYLLFLMAFVSLGLCTALAQSSIPELNLEDALKSKHTMENLSELSDQLDYVKLETNSECLINYISRLYPVNSGFLVNDSYKRLLFFDKDGRFKWKIDRRGQGPGEYSSCMATYDESRNEVLIRGLNNNLLVFDSNGKYLRSDSISYNIARLLSLPDGNLIITKNGISDGTLVRIIKPSGELVKELPDYFPIRPKGHDDVGRPIRIYSAYVHNTPNGVMIHKQDSVWSLNSDYELIPVLMTNNSIRDDNEGYYKYLVFYLDSNRIGFEISWKRKRGIYDLKKRKFYRFNGNDKTQLIDDIDGGTPFTMTYCTDGVFYNPVNPVDILTGEYNIRKGSKLEKLMDESTEDDNPILRLVHLK